MEPGEKQYKKGDLLILSTGEYSDYGIDTICKVLKTFKEQDVANLYKEDDDNYGSGKNAFIISLIKNGYIKEIKYREWRFSVYSELEFS